MPGDGNAEGERGNCMSRPITDAQAAEIHRLRDEGYSPYQVAKMTGHTSDTINNHWYDAEYTDWYNRKLKQWNNIFPGKEGREKVKEKIREAIVEYISLHGYSPTVREIGEAVGLKSTGSVQYHLKRMVKEGILEMDGKPGAPRTIRVPGYRFMEEENGRT